MLVMELGLAMETLLRMLEEMEAVIIAITLAEEAEVVVRQAQQEMAVMAQMQTQAVMEVLVVLEAQVYRLAVSEEMEALYL